MVSLELMRELIDFAEVSSRGTEINGEIYFDTKSYDDGIAFNSNHKINIHELSNVCKKWAIKKGFKLWSIVDDENSSICRVNCLEKTEYYADTEPESVFKACEWIVNHKEK